MLKKCIYILVLSVFLQSCTHFSLVSPGRTKIGDFYSVETKINWSKISANKMTTWSVDGPLIHGIIFINSILDGEPLFLIASKDEEKLPKFKAGMTPLELREVFEASLMAADAQAVKVTQLKPAKFGKLSGFRFEYNYKSKEGLEMKGIGLGVVHKDVLYALSYFAPKLYYFDKYKHEVEGIFNSIKII